MRQKPSSRRKRNSAKSILRLPALERAKATVLNSLNSADAKRGYRHAIDEFVDWYCSEPRLASTGSSSCAIALISNPVNSPLEPSICVLAPCVDSPTKRPTAVFSAPTWRPVFVA
jgi:hypothetical protein